MKTFYKFPLLPTTLDPDNAEDRVEWIEGYPLDVNTDATGYVFFTGDDTEKMTPAEAEFLGRALVSIAHRAVEIAPHLAFEPMGMQF